MESVKRARRPLEEQQAIAATPGTGPAAEASKAPTALQLAAQAHRSAAAAEAAQRELLRSTTLCWLQGAASEDEGDVLKQWGATLRQLWQDAHKVRRSLLGGRKQGQFAWGCKPRAIRAALGGRAGSAGRQSVNIWQHVASAALVCVSPMLVTRRICTSFAQTQPLMVAPNVVLASAPQDVLQPCQLRPLVQQPCFSVLAQAPQPHGRFQGVGFTSPCFLCSPYGLRDGASLAVNNSELARPGHSPS